MADEQTVRYILSTYELPTKLEDRLTGIAVRRLNELFLNRFDDQYRYIADLVDKFTRKNSEQSTESLDRLAYDDGREDLYAVVPAQPEASENRDIEVYETTGPSKTERSLERLKRELSGTQYAFVEELVNDAQVNDPLGFPRKPDNVDEIRARIDQIAQKYQVNGDIIFPRRPIKHIEFGPLQVEFGRRRLGGNPIEFYNQYRHVYGQLRRLELFHFDQGLYQALSNAGQLGEAIPESYRRRN